MNLLERSLVLILVSLSLPSFPASGQQESGPSEATKASRPVDRRKDPVYLEKQIRHISDADLFAAMDLNRAGLEKVKAAVSRADYPAAYRAWATYWISRPEFSYLRRLYHRGRSRRAEVEGNPADTTWSPFCSVEEARRELAGDTSYIAAADQVVAHNIRGWGNITIQHGPVVDFNADYGQTGKYGFNYWGWSRPLLWAYLSTGKTSYLDAFEELFNQWYEQRDSVKGGFPNVDPIYYELGLGASRNRIFLEFYRLDGDRISLRTHERLLKNFLGSGRWLYELEKQGYRSGNWQVMGSCGLAEIGLNFPEFRESSRWVAMGVQRMREHLKTDFFADGCHSERVPSSYMVTVYRDPRDLAYLLEHFRGYASLGEALRPPLERTLNWWTYMLSPLGTEPAVNDGGHGKFSAGILVDGGRTFHRPDILWVAAHLLGARISDPTHRPSRTSVDFRPSGFAAMRADWTRGSPFLSINYGPDGGWHTHADILDFELFAYGRALAVDAGNSLTYDDPLRGWYTSSVAHNMLAVDGQNINRKVAVGEKPLWSSQSHLDYFSAEQRGYLESKGVWHRRHFIFVKPDSAGKLSDSYFVIYDVFSARTPGRRVSFMLHSPTKLRETGTGYVSSGAPGLIVSTPDSVTRRRGEGMASLGGLSRPSRAPIDWIAFDRFPSAGQTDDLAVLLYPSKSTPAPQVSIRRADSACPPGTTYLVVEGQGMTDHIIVSDGQMRIFGAGRIQTDARCALVRVARDHRITYALVGGTRLIFHGKPLFETATPRDAEGEVAP